MSVHVTPVNDLIEHELSEDCMCGPEAELVEQINGGTNWLYKHNSLDGREIDEQ